MKPYTQLQILEIMYCETVNEITRNEVMERMFQRQTLRGHVQQNHQALGMIQAKLRSLRESVKDITEFLEDEKKKTVDKPPVPPVEEGGKVGE